MALPKLKCCRWSICVHRQIHFLRCPQLFTVFCLLSLHMLVSASCICLFCRSHSLHNDANPDEEEKPRIAKPCLQRHWMLLSHHDMYMRGINLPGQLAPHLAQLVRFSELLLVCSRPSLLDGRFPAVTKRCQYTRIDATFQVCKAEHIAFRLGYSRAGEVLLLRLGKTRGLTFAQVHS